MYLLVLLCKLFANLSTCISLSVSELALPFVCVDLPVIIE